MLKVLIIEDNQYTREMLSNMLERLSFQTATAIDGEVGLQKAFEIKPDVILLDINLPKIDGYEICRILKTNKDTRFIPIIMITGMAQKREKLKGIEVGADEFLAKPFDTEELLVRIRALVKTKKLNEELENVDNILSALVSIIGAKDSYTSEHSSRVEKVSVLVARKLAFSEELISILAKAAGLHDIGKIGVSEIILNKTTPLTDEEFDSIKKHPTIGEELCHPLTSLRPILKIIRHHHERYDGKGYPDGIGYEDIPIEARIIAVADSYDAMAADRPYRKRLSDEKIIEELNNGKGKQWDRKIVDCMLELLNENIIF